MESLAQRNAMLVHGLDWSERRAGIFEPAPTDDLAVATTLGLVLNCLSSGLYMVSTRALLPAACWLSDVHYTLCSITGVEVCVGLEGGGERAGGVRHQEDTHPLTHTFGSAAIKVGYSSMQANYQLVLPNIRDYLTDIGAVVSMAGVVIGCCDIASIPGTIGNVLCSWRCHLLSLLQCPPVCFILSCGCCAALIQPLQAMCSHCKPCRVTVHG